MEPESTLYASHRVFGEVSGRNRLVSVVIPLLNEQDNVSLLLAAIRKALSGIDYEVVAVDDGSSDQTVKVLKQFADHRLKIVELMRNFGQTSAMAAGIAAAEGEYIATMDGDLQNDPDDIPKMLEIARAGNWDVVAGQRAIRRDGWLRKLPSRIANFMIRRATGVYLQDYGCTLKLFKKKVAMNLGLYGELHRFIPVLASMIGARMTQVAVKHHSRVFGQSKYGLGRTMKVVSDLMLMVYMQRWMKKPMHLFGKIGVSAFAAGIILVAAQLLLALHSWAPAVAGVVLLATGTLVTLTGFLAEIQMRIYFEGSGKTPYIIREIYAQNETVLNDRIAV